MNIFLDSILKVEEIVKTIQEYLSKYCTILFIKCELIQSLFEANVQLQEKQNGVSLQSYLQSTQDISANLHVVVIDQPNIKDHIQIISKYYEILSPLGVKFEGLKGAIEYYQTLKNATLVKTFKYKSELNDIKEFRQKLIQDYNEQTIIIEFNYKLFKMFFNKFMHEKEYFTKIQCVIRILSLDKQEKLSRKKKLENAALKMVKYWFFLNKILERNYRIWIDFQLTKEENDVFDELRLFSKYGLRSIKMDSLNCNVKILGQFTNQIYGNYSTQVDQNIFEQQYISLAIFSQKETKLNLSQLCVLLSQTLNLKQLYLNNYSILQSFSALQNPKDRELDIQHQIDISSYLFSLNNVEEAIFVKDFDYDSDENFKFFTIFKHIPGKTIQIKDEKESFIITIKSIENLYYSELKIQDYDQIFVKEVAFDLDHLAILLNHYQNLLKIANTYKLQSYSSATRQNVINDIISELKTVDIFKKMNISMPELPTKGLIDFLSQILNSQTNLQTLHLKIDQTFTDLEFYFLNAQVVDVIKEECKNLQQLSINLDNSELILDLLQHYDYKLFYNDKCFEIIQQVKEEDNPQQKYNLVTFSLDGGYLGLYENVFKHYHKSKILEIQGSEQEMSIQNIIQNNELTIKGQQEVDKLEQRYQLKIYIDSVNCLSKVQWVLQKQMKDLHYVECYNYFEKLFVKEQDTFKLYSIKNHPFYSQILPKSIKTLIIYEEWNRMLNDLLEVLFSQNIFVENLEINFIMYTYEENLYEKLKKINYKFLRINFIYNGIQLMNLRTVLKSLRLNNYFYDLRAIQKNIELKISLSNFMSQQEINECMIILKIIQDNQFHIKPKVEGKKLVQKKDKHILQANSFFFRTYTSYKYLKRNSVIQSNFRNDIILHICEMY